MQKPIGLFNLRFLKKNNLSESRNLCWKVNNRCVDSPGFRVSTWLHYLIEIFVNGKMYCTIEAQNLVK